MATTTLATVYPTMSVSTAKALRNAGFRYLKTYRAVMDAATVKDKAIFRSLLGVSCLGCLDQGYRWTGATRKTSVACGCAVGRTLARSTTVRRATRLNARKDYAVQVIGSGYGAAPQDRTYASVQRAMADAKKLLQTVPTGAKIDVVHRTKFADVYRLVARWEVNASDYERVA